jgi:hypothetical protein
LSEKKKEKFIEPLPNTISSIAETLELNKPAKETAGDSSPYKSTYFEKGSMKELNLPKLPRTTIPLVKK